MLGFGAVFRTLRNGFAGLKMPERVLQKTEIA